MLTQLNRLSVEVDGRYATAEELQFIKGYFESLEKRSSAYEKIKNFEAEIISKTEAKMRSLDPNIFLNASGDFTDTWKKDIGQLLRYAAAGALLSEQERLKEELLLWHNTIAKSFKFDRTCKMTFTVMPEVVKQCLPPEEAALFLPILELYKIVLGN